MGGKLTIQEQENIEKLEKMYSPQNIKSSNALLKLRALDQQIKEIDAWRNAKLLEATTLLEKAKQKEENDGE